MDLKITIIQSELYWERVVENLEMFTEKIKGISGETDLIVLPEMFNTGFSMQSNLLSEKMDGLTISWMLVEAKKVNAVIVGSIIIEDNERFYNRLVWVEPSGKVETYDKRHLFRMADENSYFSEGEKRLIVSYKGWKICPLICYDLRFPVWSRNKKIAADKVLNINDKEESFMVYDLLIYIANWPEVRKSPWEILLRARAVENQSYVLGVNRVGVDGKGYSYSGNSMLINPKGETISAIPESENYTETCIVSMKELKRFRTGFPVGIDADNFDIRL